MPPKRPGNMASATRPAIQLQLSMAAFKLPGSHCGIWKPVVLTAPAAKVGRRNIFKERHNFEIMPKDIDAQAEIKAALDRYTSAYSNKDVKMLLSIIDPGFFGFGSGPDEKVSSADELKSQLERDFAQSGSLAIDFRPMAMAQDGNVAWCAGDSTVSAIVGGQQIKLEGRMTAVLRRSGRGWLFAHIHFSVPDRGQAAGQSFPMEG
jgi:ketosteroid isomerase-like protein